MSEQNFITVEQLKTLIKRSEREVRVETIQGYWTGVETIRFVDTDLLIDNMERLNDVSIQVL